MAHHSNLPQMLAASPVAAAAAPVGHSSSSPQSAMMGGMNAPCSTLFVANLGQFVSEQELKELFASFPGYCRLRMHNKGGSPVAFIEYADVRFAAHALLSLQGSYLLSSDRGGIRIEYARSKMSDPGTSPTSSSGDKTPTEAEAAKLSFALAGNPAAAAALSQAVHGAPLHAVGIYGHQMWLSGMQD